jgi:Cytochrome P460
MKKSFTLFALAVLALPAFAADQAQVPYPQGYRNWHHVKSMVINPGHPLHDAFGGIHHLYANKKAVAGYKQGNFADGSVIVFDLLQAKDENNTIIEGDRKVVGVMRKNSKKFTDTGGWGFEGFAGNSKTERVVGKNAVSACYQCHTAQKEKDYVFSALRD